ncbi:MAG TPA: histidine kinase [Bryobacteraceae bacterium]|nr:histidine kinase [Bryobacteraceae bacterium]
MIDPIGSADQPRGLARRLLDAHDEKCKRVARQLHDHAGQNLSALAIHLSLLLSNARDLDARTRKGLEECVELAGLCVREIRKLSYSLHPPLLDELGLVSALHAFADRYAQQTGARLDLTLPATARRLPPAVEIGLFRIIEEGLGEPLASGGKTASLLLKFEGAQVELELRPPGWDAASASPDNIGIATITERVLSLGGQLTIASGPDGTTLRVVIPTTSEA